MFIVIGTTTKRERERETESMDWDIPRKRLGDHRRRWATPVEWWGANMFVLPCPPLWTIHTFHLVFLSSFSSSALLFHRNALLATAVVNENAAQPSVDLLMTWSLMVFLHIVRARSYTFGPLWSIFFRSMNYVYERVIVIFPWWKLWCNRPFPSRRH